MLIFISFSFLAIYSSADIPEYCRHRVETNIRLRVVWNQWIKCKIKLEQRAPYFFFNKLLNFVSNFWLYVSNWYAQSSSLSTVCSISSICSRYGNCVWMDETMRINWEWRPQHILSSVKCSSLNNKQATAHVNSPNYRISLWAAPTTLPSSRWFVAYPSILRLSLGSCSRAVCNRQSTHWARA